MSDPDISVIDADENVFEIYDYTVITELETLIASLEGILESINSSITNCANNTKENQSELSKERFVPQHLRYNKDEFTVSYHHDACSLSLTESAQEEDFEDLLAHVSNGSRELTEFKRDFREGSSITRQFGVSSYVVISPFNNIVTEVNLNTILSAIETAVLNIECELPVFLQFGEASRDLHFGVCKNRNACTRFDSARVRTPLVVHKFFNGLYDVFRQKVGIDISVKNRTTASVELEYVHRRASPTPSVVNACDNNGAHGEEVNYKEADGGEDAKISDDSQQDAKQQPIDFTYRFGADFDPFKQLNLCVCWLNVNASLLNESLGYTEFDPLSAPKWFVSAAFHDDSKYLLSSMLTDLLDCRDGPCSSCSLFSFTEKWTAVDVPTSAANALDSIANNFSSTQLKFFSQQTSEPVTKPIETPLDVATRYLDECLKNIKNESVDLIDDDVNEKNDYYDLKQMTKNMLDSVKSAPYDSLTNNLAKCLITTFLCESDSELGCLWWKFVRYLRNSWENCTPLPGLFWDEQRPIDLSKCLLHQKLQMVDTCIRKKLERSSDLDLKCETESRGTRDEMEDDDESFYDANETFDSYTTASSTEVKARGRSHVMNSSEFLLNYPNERLIYVPLTQDFGPMTEDMFEEHTSYLTSLDSESGDRTRAQLDILLSDMQAFKAANPGSVLEDFVRWHSPRDFIQEANDGKGALSDRMNQEDSVWTETWNNARAVPVAQQSRLFNETKVFEKILQHFEGLSMAELVDLLLPIVAADSIRTLIEKSVLCPSLVKDRILVLCKLASKNLRTWNLDTFYEIRSKVEAIEVLISRYSSLQTLLWPKRVANDGELLEESSLNSFVEQLLTTERSSADVLRERKTKRVQVIDAPLGPLARSIHNCFKNELTDDESENDRFKMPPPYRKQYIIRWTVPRPGINSRLMPQRMYASVTEGGVADEDPNFFISGSFTSDMTFK